jgi:uncharacterized membrane protein
MSHKTLRLWRGIVVIIVAILVGWSVASGNAWIPVPAVIVGIVAVILLKRGLKEVIVDERIFSVADKAAMLAFRIFTILAATAGATMLALSREGNPDLEQAGFTLAYSACALLLFYYIAFTFYNRKYGGKE